MRSVSLIVIPSPLAKHGRPQKNADKGYNVTFSERGNNRKYILARLARDDAKPGMRVEVAFVDGTGPEYGKIIHVEPDACVVRLDKPRYEGERPFDAEGANRVITLEWDAVRLMGIQPAAVNGVKVIAPGENVMIDMGDGNSDKPGVVLLAMPDYCVVRLDAPLEMGGGPHAAADWHLIRFADLGDADKEIAAAMQEQGREP